MSTVKLYTVQEKKNIGKILDGSYKSRLDKGYASWDDNFLNGYSDMLDRLSKKTGIKRDNNRSCMWAWYKNPFWENHKNIQNIGKDLALITFFGDSRELIASDFDIWCDRLEGESERDYEISLEGDKLLDNRSIQVVLWDVDPNRILSIENFK